MHVKTGNAKEEEENNCPWYGNMLTTEHILGRKCLALEEKFGNPLEEFFIKKKVMKRNIIRLGVFEKCEIGLHIKEWHSQNISSVKSKDVRREI